MKLQEKLRSLRQEQELSVDTMAKRTGISAPYIRQLENGRKTNPTGAVLKKLATALGTTVADLIGASTAIPDTSLKHIPPSLRKMVRSRDQAGRCGNAPIDSLPGQTAPYRR